MTKPAATESAIRRSDSLSTSCSAAILLFLVTLAIWLLRVLVRLMLRNLHQGADAASRATMTQAYLALLAEGGPSRRPSRNRPSGAHSVNRTCTASSGFVHRNSLISGAVMPPPRCDRLLAGHGKNTRRYAAASVSNTDYAACVRRAGSHLARVPQSFVVVVADHQRIDARLAVGLVSADHDILLVLQLQLDPSARAVSWCHDVQPAADLNESTKLDELAEMLTDMLAETGRPLPLTEAER